MILVRNMSCNEIDTLFGSTNTVESGTVDSGDNVESQEYSGMRTSRTIPYVFFIRLYFAKESITRSGINQT
mgnify:CR=1 FL=1